MRPRIDWQLVFVWGGAVAASLLAWVGISYVVVTAWRTLGVV